MKKLLFVLFYIGGLATPVYSDKPYSSFRDSLHAFAKNMNHPTGFNKATQTFPRPWRTFCIGRFLIDLPTGTQIRSTFVTQGSRVQTFENIDSSVFQDKLSSKQRSLLATEHEQGGSMLVDRDDISPHHVTFVSWSSRVSRRIYQYEEYRYIPEQQVLFVFTGSGTANTTARRKAAEIQRQYANAITYRNSLDIPVRPGFCICNGFIEGSSLNKEEMDVVFDFPTLADYPDLLVSISTFVTANEQQPPDPHQKPAPAIMRGTTLRQGFKPWHGRQAVEHIWKFRKEGKWYYEFTLRIPSKAHDLAHPFIKIRLTEKEIGSTDAADENKRSSFRNDTDALAFWDNVLEGFRYRPGAVQTDD